jgi:hypothetical protein
MREVVGKDLALLREGLIRLLVARGFDVVAAVDKAMNGRPHPATGAGPVVDHFGRRYQSWAVLGSLLTVVEILPNI